MKFLCDCFTIVQLSQYTLSYCYGYRASENCFLLTIINLHIIFEYRLESQLQCGILGECRLIEQMGSDELIYLWVQNNIISFISILFIGYVLSARM